MAHATSIVTNGRTRLSRFARFSSIALGVSVALGLVLFAASAHAQTDFPIYSDAPLDDGWQNWSWATVDVASTAAPHGGATSIAVAATGFSALALRHDPFNTTGYGNLTFWINGGVAGQARLVVVATLGDVGQKVFVDIGPLAPNTWKQASVPLASLGADNVANFTGFWIQEFTGTDQTANPFYVDDIVLTGSVPIIPAPPLDGGMALYDDRFTNGWENWSWANVNTGNVTPVNSISFRIIVGDLRYLLDPHHRRFYFSIRKELDPSEPRSAPVHAHPLGLGRKLNAGGGRP